MTFLRLTSIRSFGPRVLRPCRFASYPSRNFAQTSLSAYPRKGYEDRESINTEATEYSKSGTDNEVAQSDEAFDPSKTKPEQEKNTTGKGKNVNPLEVSPGNPEVSKQGGKEAEGGSEGSAKNKKSESGSPQKNG